MNYLMDIIIGLGGGFVLFKLIGAVTQARAATLTNTVSVIAK